MEPFQFTVKDLLDWQGDPAKPFAIERKHRLLRLSFLFWFVFGTPITLFMSGDIPAGYRVFSICFVLAQFGVIGILLYKRKVDEAILCSILAFIISIFYLQMVFGEQSRAHYLIFSLTILIFSLYNRLPFIVLALFNLAFYSISVFYHAHFDSLLEVRPSRIYDWYIGVLNLGFLTLHAAYHSQTFALIKHMSSEKRSELLRLNQKLTEHQTALEKVNLELHQFASCASHDMREPLRTMSSFSTLVSNRLPKDDKNQELLAFVTDAAKRMTVLLDDLISYTRITQVNSQDSGWTDLNLVLDEVKKNLFLKIAESDATIEAMDLPVVKANKTHLLLLFQNLLSNAIKYASPDRKPHISIKWIRKDEGMVLLFKDNGIGIEQKYINEIFEPFRRLHAIGKYEGSGIGLATCRKIVDYYKGNITATSEYGYSTTMVVELQFEILHQPGRSGILVLEGEHAQKTSVS